MSVRNNALTPEDMARTYAAVAIICKNLWQRPIWNATRVLCGCMIIIIAAVDISMMLFTAHSMMEGTPMGEGIMPYLVAMIGAILMVCFHVISHRFNESAPFLFLRAMVACLIIAGLIGLGVIYATEITTLLNSVTGSDLSIDENGDMTRPEKPWLVAVVSDWLMSNLKALLPLGMAGLVITSAVAVDYFWGKLVHANERIKEAADRAGLKILCKQVKASNDAVLRANLDTDRILGQMADFEERLVAKIVTVGNNALGELNLAITQLELASRSQNKGETHPRFADIMILGRPERVDLDALKEKRDLIVQSIEPDRVRALVAACGIRPKSIHY